MKLLEKTALPLVLVAVVLAQTEQPAIEFMKVSPILEAIDANQDSTISPAEVAASATVLKKLDKNSDGKLTREEAGIPAAQLPGRGAAKGGEGKGKEKGKGRDGEEVETPAPPPAADDMTASLMMFDANNNGQLEKKEVPERFQGVFERGDANKNGILTKEELTALAQGSREMKLPPRINRADMAMLALDTDNDTEISTAEINAAPKSLLALDKNGDGQITNDEVTPPPQGQGKGPGGPKQ